MAMWRSLRSWLSWFPWYHRRTREADLERELRDYLELEADEHRAVGKSPEEAAYAAHRAFCNTLKIEEDVRVAWGFQWLETLAQDMRFGLRQLRRNPGSRLSLCSRWRWALARTPQFSAWLTLFSCGPCPTRSPTD